MVIVDMASRIGQPGSRFHFGHRPAPGRDSLYDRWRRYASDTGSLSRSCFPIRADVSAMVSQHGPNLFYDSPEARELCCEVRKVRPLERKLRELKAWATGLRREQSGDARRHAPKSRRWMGGFADQSAGGLDRRRGGPVHSANTACPCILYTARGYTSIGCAPCTRARGAGRGRARRALVVGAGRLAKSAASISPPTGWCARA